MKHSSRDVDLSPAAPRPEGFPSDQAALPEGMQREKMRAFGELAHGVAHDFNNALMAILGYAELAEDSQNDAEMLATCLSAIKQAALEASQTVRRFQRFTRQGNAAQQEWIDVNRIVQDVIEMTQPQWKDNAQRAGLTYHINVDLQSVAPLMVEPNSLREVLINMVYNALSAMPEGGTLTLKTLPIEHNRVEISVTDTGIGMTPEVMERVFDPFFTTRGTEGAGLGLAVAWTTIQRYGGTITVESAPGQGTCFHILLPIRSHEETLETEGSAEQARLPLSAQSATYLLIVDDEPFVTNVLQSILSRQGVHVTVTHSAKEALQVLRENAETYHVVLTDHGMPEMTGLQLVEEIKRVWPEMPVVLLTGWGEGLLPIPAGGALPDVVLSKPVNQRDLLDTVRLMARKKTAGALQERPSHAIVKARGTASRRQSKPSTKE